MSLIDRCLTGMLLGVLLALLPAPAAGADASRPAAPPRGVADDDDEKDEAKDADDPAPSDEAAADEAGDDEEDDEEDVDEPDRWLAVTGGTVHTVSDGVLHAGTVLCKNGRIHAVGRAVVVPEEAEVLDAAGLHVYPGLVAVETSGVVRSPNAADAWSLNRSLAMSAGITTAIVGNGAYKTARGTLEGLTVADGLFETLRYDSRRPRAKRQQREAFEEAREHLRKVERHRRDKQRNPDLEEEAPKKNELSRDAQRALRLITGEARAIADAETAGDLRELAALAGRYGFDLVVRGAREGWTVAPELARAGISCIVAPRRRGEPDESVNRPNGPTIENAGILHDHGVPVAVVPAGTPFFGGGDGTGISLLGLAGRDLLTLPMAAAFAVRGGLPEDAAVRAITLDAARIMGVDHRVGSIEPGKDADFAITDGDLLHYMTFVRYTVINGELAYDKQAEGLFDHVRPPADEPSPAIDRWPRRLGDPWGGDFVAAIAAERAAREAEANRQAEQDAEADAGAEAGDDDADDAGGDASSDQAEPAEPADDGEADDEAPSDP